MRLFNVHISVICVIICSISAAEIEKRAPLGFTGVRGKKSANDSPYTDTTSDESSQSSRILVEDNSGDIDKRAPSGFLGMRGKKPFEEYNPLDYPLGYFKRAPSGFFGVRGKKEMDEYGMYFYNL